MNAITPVVATPLDRVKTTCGKYEILHSCEGCPFRGAKVGWRGNPKAEMVIVGEAPGYEEVSGKVKIPFIGPSGRLLWDAIPSEVTDDTLFISNAMQCQPKGNDGKEFENKKVVATQLCHDRLMAEITAHPRKIILALGNWALRSITGDYNAKITQLRGKLLATPYASVGLIPAVHPAALLRGTGSYRQFKTDIAYAIGLAKGDSPKSPISPKYSVPRTGGQIRRAVNHIAAATLREGSNVIAGDIETGGFDILSDEILSLGVAYDPRHVYIFPDSILQHAEVKRLLRFKHIRWLWHNGKFDTQFLNRDGLEAEVGEDTMLLSYASDESGGIHDLEQLSSDLLGAQDYKHVIKPYIVDATFKTASGKKKKIKGAKSNKGSYRNVPRPLLYEYQAKDVSNTLQDYQVLRPQIRGDKALEKLYTRTLIPASEFLREIEKNGIYVDFEQVAKNDVIETEKINQAEAAVFDLTGMSLNLNSPKQVSQLLFGKLRLPDIAKGSTAAWVLDKLPGHPVVKALKLFRRAAKIKSTYVTSLYQHANPKDGRVHSTYLIHGTRTGRLSSRNPNMQNQPRENRIRSMFVAPPGRILVAVDLNQAELRSLAWCSKDPGLMAIYCDPTKGSLHDEVVQLKFGDQYVNAGKEERRELKMKAKNVNFGVVYGITSAGLSEQLGGTTAEAQEFLEWWFARFPVAKKFIDNCREAAANARTITTLFGRKKRHWVVTRENAHDLMNEASNFPHQSIASDITLQTGIKMSKRKLLLPYDSKFVNIIHDELLMEVPNTSACIEAVSKLGIHEMQQTPIEWGIKSIPFKGEAKIGRAWGDMEELKHAA